MRIFICKLNKQHLRSVNYTNSKIPKKLNELITNRRKSAQTPKPYESIQNVTTEITSAASKKTPHPALTKRKQQFRRNRENLRKLRTSKKLSRKRVDGTRANRRPPESCTDADTTASNYRFEFWSATVPAPYHPPLPEPPLGPSRGCAAGERGPGGEAGCVDLRVRKFG